jgi:hypothetical protein
VRPSKIHSCTLYSDSVKDKQPFQLRCQEILIAVAWYRQGPDTYYIKLSYETLSTSHSQVAQPSPPNPLGSQAAGKLLGIFNKMFKTGQVNNCEAPIPGRGFLNQVREQELREKGSEKRAQSQTLTTLPTRTAIVANQIDQLDTDGPRHVQKVPSAFNAHSTALHPERVGKHGLVAVTRERRCLSGFNASESVDSQAERHGVELDDVEDIFL